jgi:hypothetical protein
MKKSGAGRGSATVRVSVRLRPPLHGSTRRDGLATVCDGSSHISVRDKTFTYPSAVVVGSNQVGAFNTLAQQLVTKTEQGFSCTLIAYGQTGSGKTYTMFGPTGCLTESSVDEAYPNIPEMWGIFPRFVMNILNSNKSTVLHASAIEVYQNVAFDLNNDRKILRIGTSGTKNYNVVPMNAPADISADMRPTAAGTHPSGCSCFHCFKYQEEQKKRAKKKKIADARRKPSSSSMARNSAAGGGGQNEFKTVGEKLTPLKTAKDVARLARTIEQTRAAKGHLLNERSSRSHCLVRVSWLCNGKKVSLLFVDLAGSERISKSGVSGQKKLEAAQINNSLTTLGRCINRLVRKDGHVPYRDSTLTMLLRSSLGGRCVTNVIVCVSPEQEHEDESRCTLRFGQRMTGVTSSGVVNKTIDVGREKGIVERQLKQLRRELRDLDARGQGSTTGKSSNIAANKLILENMAKLEKMESKLQAMQNALVEARYKGDTYQVNKLEGMIETLSARTLNHKDVVLRQKTIKGLHVESSHAYQQKQAEISELEGKLRMFGGGGGGGSSRRKK